MKIRRKSEKLGSPDGVPPLHPLITCTYQKLFKKDCVLLDNGAAAAGNGGHGTSAPGAVPHPRPKLHRPELGSSWLGNIGGILRVRRRCCALRLIVRVLVYGFCHVFGFRWNSAVVMASGPILNAFSEVACAWFHGVRRGVGWGLCLHGGD